MIEQKIETPETQLVSDLISIIGETCGYFRGLVLTRAVNSIYNSNARDDVYAQERCARLCEELANAKMHHGQGFITKGNLITDIEAAVECYGKAKITADLERATISCPTGNLRN